MLTNIALLFLLGLLLGQLCTRIHLPALVGYLAAGILLGPGVLHALTPDFLVLSPDFRRFALIVILLRAGLALNLQDLRQVGRPAVFLCFVPACFEILGCTLLAPPLLGLSYLEGALLGSVIAAVSPAVVVPRMLRLIESGRGVRHAIPQMILAGASVDDVFVLVMFSAFCSMLQGDGFSMLTFLHVPVSIILGCLLGLLLGMFFVFFFRRIPLRDIAKLLVLLSFSFLAMTLEDYSPVPFSGMLAVMTMGITILRRDPVTAKSFSDKLNSIWVAAELLLFALVGAAVDLTYVYTAGLAAVLLIFCALLFRMAGVLTSVTGTALTRNERIFSMFAYCPKATVQAAIGGVPLALGLSCGSVVLTAAVLAILLTAPLGAFIIDHFAEKLLS